jgi:tRNA pseudouridine55 synthase
VTARVEGLALVDKPEGITSHDAVDAVRSALGIRKVGHAGTLDPMATGLLVMGVGRATRLLRFLGYLDKTYEGEMRLGIRTDTLDATGEVTEVRAVSVSAGDVGEAMRGLVGSSLQTPPAYSAVKVAGQKLYEAARRGRRLDADPRPIRVESFDLLAFDPPNAAFSVVCSGGTFVRSLVDSVGVTLDCGAHLTKLRRTRIGPFDVADAHPPGSPVLLPVERAVAHLDRIQLDIHEAEAARHGRVLAPSGFAAPYAVFGPEDRLIGVYRDDGSRSVPEVILG